MTKLSLEHYPIKDELMVHTSNNYNSFVTFKRASKKRMIDSIKGITKENIIKDCSVVKNAIVFEKNDVLYCKHYDTIIFAFDLKRKEIIEMYLNCSQTSNNQLSYIRNYLEKYNLMTKSESHTFWSAKTKSEPTTRGYRNQFSVSE